jgi:hypothetical protein
VNDREIDQLLRKLEPGGEPGLEGLLREAGQELLEEIMSTQPEKVFEADEIAVHEVVPLPREGQERHRLRWVVGIAAAVAVVLAIILPMTLMQRSGMAIPADRLPQKPLIGKGNPYLMLEDPRWPMDYLQEERADLGEEHFVLNQESSLKVHWYPADQYDGYFDDRSADSKPSRLRLFGVDAALFDQGHGTYEVMLPVSGNVFLDLRGDGIDSLDTFAGLLANLRQLGQSEWYAALPTEMVTPDRSVAMAKEMLRDVPLPKGTRAEQFSSSLSSDYYQFGVKVIAPVACAWFAEYERARDVGDEKTMAKVADVFRGSRDWKVLQTMSKVGGWPDSIWMWGDRVGKRQDVWGTRNELHCQGGSQK